MEVKSDGFIDLHCHILPYLDDGASDLSESIAMARLAAAEGVAHVVATPHYMPGVFQASPEQIEGAVETLNEAVKREGIPVTVYPGSELYLDEAIPDLLRKGNVLSLNHGKYVLIELPRTDFPSYTEEILFRISLAGYHPIIAHPERNSAVMTNPMVLKPVLDKGTIVQITVGSLVGEYGRRVRLTAERVLRMANSWVLGSDWHSGLTRPAVHLEALRRASIVAGAGSVANSHQQAKKILGI